MSAELSPDLLHVDALLRGAARDFAYPATPPIATRVSALLRERAARPSLFEGLWGAPPARAAAGALAALLAVIGISLAVPQSRDALADFFGLSGVRIDRTPITGPTPAPLAPQSFAQPATIEEAEAIVQFPLRFPTEDGARLEPRAVYLVDLNSTIPFPIFVYEEYDLWQRSGGFFGKGGPDPSLIHEIEFDGQPAVWIDEGGHVAQSYDEYGRLLIETVRSVDRATLLWERDGITYRLETSLSREEAFEVARSLR